MIFIIPLILQINYVVGGYKKYNLLKIFATSEGLNYVKGRILGKGS